jgi:hypothetical protein
LPLGPLARPLPPLEVTSRPAVCRARISVDGFITINATVIAYIIGLKSASTKNVLSRSGAELFTRPPAHQRSIVALDMQSSPMITTRSICGLSIHRSSGLAERACTASRHPQ